MVQACHRNQRRRIIIIEQKGYIMKKLFSIITILVLSLSLFTGCGSKEKEDGTSEAQTAAPADTTESTESPDSGELMTGTHHVEIEVKDYGTISVELYADIAPITVTNFINLANDGFYDGLTFHRIMDGFMIQGGDPLGNGTGGSSQTITGEFSLNGYEENNISHVRGTISMARAQDYNSASSQFFIVQSDSTALDGQYAGFGTVTDGMDIVDQICKDAEPTDENGTISPDEQPIITSIKVID